MSENNPYKDGKICLKKIEINTNRLIQEIVSCLLELNATRQPITWKNFIESMQDTIVNSYKKDKNMADFKGDWKARFRSVAKMLHMNIEASQDSWSIIKERIRPSDDNNLTSSTSNPIETERVSTSNDTSSSKSSSTRQSSTEKNYRLTAEEKNKCRIMYESLDRSNMWVLSTGTIVEKQMAAFALDCIYEHPAHSLILDVSDGVWKDYFSIEEINEIIGTKRTPLPSLPEELSMYINSFDKDFTDPLNLYYQVNNKVFHPFEEKDKKWVQQTIRSAADLYLYKILDSCNSLEAKAKHRVWSFLYTLFDGSNIETEIGEKSSLASAARRNNERKLEGQEARRRRNMGNKMDMLFFCDDCELGCAEVGKDSVGVDVDKYMTDGMLKLPKSLKDMLCMATKVCPDRLRDLKMIGYIIMGKHFKL
jgi:hypothetical protein